MEEGALHLISGRFLPAAALDLETPDALSFTEHVLKHDRA